VKAFETLLTMKTTEYLDFGQPLFRYDLFEMSQAFSHKAAVPARLDPF
jgi:hypothetical protein